MAYVFRQTIRHLRTANLLLLVFYSLFTAPSAQAQERDWEPQRTWVFVVGTLRWKHADMFEPFPQENRRDAELVTFFRHQGVPASQIVYLRDKEATAKRIQREMMMRLASARKEDWLFLYYTGHGYKSDDGDAYLASYDAGDEGVAGWPVKSIPITIERFFKGSRAFLALDNCYSGALAEAVTKRMGRVSYAVLTSSSANRTSTSEWTFTEALLAALRGKAYVDLNGDRQITMVELADHVKEDMAFAERQRAVFVTTGDFSSQMILSRAEEKRDSRIGERVMVRSEGSWYKGQIIDANRARSRFLIHYYGWDYSYNEWVGIKQIRQLRIKRYIGNQDEVDKTGRVNSLPTTRSPLVIQNSVGR